jgi:hypothetical protein
VSKDKGIFLVAQYYKKPQPHVNTSKKGWMDNPDNIRWDEQMIVTRGIKPKDANAQVILNLSEKTVVRNSFTPDKPFDEVFRYFFTGYSQYLAPVMGQLDQAYLLNLAQEIQAEIEAEFPETMTDAEMKAAQAKESQAEVVDAEYEEVKAE